MKLITIVGARPQFIKAAVVSRAVAEKTKIKELIVHTGQHFDSNMSDVFFKEMNIPVPDYNLGINGLTHGAMTGQMLMKIEEVLLIERPDMVLVYGDTNSTIAGALAAAKIHIPVAHVEAGLRSFNNSMPEEINRILTDRISNILFCPTDNALVNLEREGFDNYDCKIIKSGDVMLDAAMYYAENSSDKSKIIDKLKLDEFCVCTLHRAENTDSPKKLRDIFSALTEVSQEITVVLPVHPRTKKIIKEMSLDTAGITVIDPVGYFDMIELLKNCRVVFTDSGGLQKEAFFFAKPCITLREETEWVELVENGYNLLVGNSGSAILAAYKNMKTKKIVFNAGLYGDGKAGTRIVTSLLS